MVFDLVKRALPSRHRAAVERIAFTEVSTRRWWELFRTRPNFFSSLRLLPTEKMLKLMLVHNGRRARLRDRDARKDAKTKDWGGDLG